MYLIMYLPIDNLRIIYNFLPMPDKRNLIRVNKKCNVMSNLIPNVENEFWQSLPTYTIDYKYFSMKKMTKLENLTMEMLYYGYVSIMPRSYINNYNRLFREKYLHFHAGVIGNKEIIHMLISLTDNNTILMGLAYSGYFELLKTCVKLIKIYIDDVVYAATAGRHTKILKWILRNYNPNDPYGEMLVDTINDYIKFGFFQEKNNDKYKYYVNAIQNGYMDIVVNYHNQNYKIDNACEIAASGNQLEMLKWLRDKNYPFDEKVCRAAAKHKHFDLLKWLHENGCPWDRKTTVKVIRSGNLEMLKWLFERKNSGGAFDKYMLLYAAESGNLKMVKYLYHNGFRIGSRIYDYALRGGNLKLIKWLAQYIPIIVDKNMCKNASKDGHYDILKWLAKQNIQCKKNIAENIFRNGDFEMLDWIFKNKIPVTEYSCSKIAEYGRLDVLKKVRNEGCEWNYEVCEMAEKNGFVDIVRWAHNNGCEWQDCECYEKNLKYNGMCQFTEKSIEKWLKKMYNKEFNFIKIKLCD